MTQTVSFGSFRLHPAQRLLLQADKPISLGSRALDILIVLVERAGELVSKDELMARAWPNISVVPANLAVQLSALRRALRDGRDGNRFVISIPGRGYRFVAPVRFADDSQPSAPEPNPPIRLARSIERAGNVEQLGEWLTQRPLLTIAPSGGHGNLAVACALAERIIEACGHGIWPIDPTPLGNPSLLASAIAAAFLILMLDEESAVVAVSRLMPDDRGQRDALTALIGRVLGSGGPMQEEGKHRLARVAGLFGEPAAQSLDSNRQRSSTAA
jgi:DNA-binding winged helix-turn-helix (wHTH) protein